MSMKYQLRFLYDFPHPHSAIIHASCHRPFTTEAINGRYTVLVTKPAGRGDRGWERTEGGRKKRMEANWKWDMEGKEKESGHNERGGKEMNASEGTENEDRGRWRIQLGFSLRGRGNSYISTDHIFHVARPTHQIKVLYCERKQPKNRD